jgi:hypothetical protein
MGRIIIPLRRPVTTQQPSQYATPQRQPETIDTINKWMPLVKTGLDIGVAGGSRLLGSLERHGQQPNVQGQPGQPAPQNDPIRDAAMGILGQNQGEMTGSLGGDPLASIAAQRYAPQPASPQAPTQARFGIGGDIAGQPQGLPDTAQQPPQYSDLITPREMLPAYQSGNGVQFPGMMLPDYQQQLRDLPANSVAFGDTRPQGPEAQIAYGARTSGMDQMNRERAGIQSADNALADIAAERARPKQMPAFQLPQSAGLAQRQQFVQPPAAAPVEPPPVQTAQQPAQAPEAPQTAMDQPADVQAPQQPARAFSGPVTMANLRVMAAEAGRTGNEKLAQQVMQKFVEADDLDVHPNSFMDWVTGDYQSRAQNELLGLAKSSGKQESDADRAWREIRIEDTKDRIKDRRETRPGRVAGATGRGNVWEAKGEQATEQEAARTRKMEADALIAETKVKYADVLEAARAGDKKAQAQSRQIEANLNERLAELGVPEAQAKAKLGLTRAQTSATSMNAGSNRIKANAYAAWVAKYSPYVRVDAGTANQQKTKAQMEAEARKLRADQAILEGIARGEAVTFDEAFSKAYDMGKAGGAVLADDAKKRDAKGKADGTRKAADDLEDLIATMPQ